MVVICQSIFKVNKIIIARTPEEFLEVVRLEFYLNNRHHIITRGSLGVANVLDNL